MREQSREASAPALARDTCFTFAQVCRFSGTSAQTVLELVEYGVVEPAAPSPGRWYFRADDLRRLQVAIRLQRDLELNTAGAAVALELLEELQGLRDEVQVLERQLIGLRTRR